MKALLAGLVALAALSVAYADTKTPGNGVATGTITPSQIAPGNLPSGVLSSAGNPLVDTAAAQISGSSKGAIFSGASTVQPVNVIYLSGAYGDSVNTKYLVTSASSSPSVTFATSGGFLAPFFASADVGKPIEIAGIGAAGAVLTTTIASVQSATQITLAANAATSVTATNEAVIYGHDDTTAMQAAFNASANAQLVIPCTAAGYGYRITGALTTPQHAHIRGSVENAYYYYPGTSTSIPVPCGLLIGDQLQISGGATALVNIGLYSVIDGVGFSLPQGPSIPVLYGTGAWVVLRNNYVYGGLTGIEQNYNASPFNQGWVIEGNDVSGAGGDCIFLNSTADNMVTGNWSHACTLNALNLNAAGATQVIGNVLEDSLTGIRVGSNSDRDTITANKLDGNSSTNIYFSGFIGNVAIVGNMFDPPTGSGSSHYDFNAGTQSGSINAAGNTYNTTDATTTNYVFASSGTFTLGPSFWFDIPSVMTGGLYDSAGTQAVIAPYLTSAAKAANGNTFTGGNAGALASGSNSTVTGQGSLATSGATGSNETITGANSGTAAMTGAGNVVTGEGTATHLTSGQHNTIIGTGAASSNLSTGQDNVIIGYQNDTIGSGTSFEASIQGALIGFTYSALISVTSGGGTSPTIAGSGTFLFYVTEGSGTPSATLVLGMPGAAVDWQCEAYDRNNALVTGASTGAASTTVATITFSLAPAAGDLIAVKCLAY